MKINNINSISFGYNSVLKKDWKKGLLPTVQKGFYGDTLTKNNISLEHLIPHSQGGKTQLNNLVLASKDKNMLRGTNPLNLFITKDTVQAYLDQFVGITTKHFDGNTYIQAIIKTLKMLGIDLTQL